MHFEFPLKSAFVAVPLGGDAKREFHDMQRSLEDFSDILRFQKPETPHLTLQFWKELMEIEYAPIVDKIDDIATKTDPFDLAITGVDTFAYRGQEKVLYCTVAFSEPLAKLKKRCPWPADRPFVPHVTLARMKNPQAFAAKKKTIMKRLAGRSFTMCCDRLRLYAEVNGIKQTPIHESSFSSSSSFRGA